MVSIPYSGNCWSRRLPPSADRSPWPTGRWAYSGIAGGSDNWGDSEPRAFARVSLNFSYSSTPSHVTFFPRRGLATFGNHASYGGDVDGWTETRDNRYSSRDPYLDGDDERVLGSQTAAHPAAEILSPASGAKT